MRLDMVGISVWVERATRVEVLVLFAKNEFYLGQVEVDEHGMSESICVCAEGDLNSPLVRAASHWRTGEMAEWSKAHLC